MRYSKSMNNNNESIVHKVAPDAGMNVRCTCGAEYSLVANLMRHIARENA